MKRVLVLSAALLFLALTSTVSATDNPQEPLVQPDNAVGSCQQGCFCYYATYEGGQCGTVARDGCYVLSCCCS